MTISDWETFTLVGYSRHAAKHIIPALAANDHKLAAVVSKRAPLRELGKIKSFDNLEKAIKYSKKNSTCFLLASYPSDHFPLAQKILQNGFDVLIEKPAITSAAQGNYIKENFSKTSNFACELLMYKYSRIFGKFFECWQKNQKKIENLDIRFLLPELKASTFRDDSKITNSILYDIGAYPFSLLAELNICHQDFEVKACESSQGLIRSVELASYLPTSVNIKIGFGFDYENSVEITTNSGSKKKFSPFFYGRSGVRCVQTTSALGNVVELQIPEENCFEVMLAQKRDYWKSQRESNYENMIACYEKIEAISKYCP